MLKFKEIRGEGKIPKKLVETEELLAYANPPLQSKYLK
jgi:hypothetical protein